MNGEVVVTESSHWVRLMKAAGELRRRDVAMRRRDALTRISTLGLRLWEWVARTGKRTARSVRVGGRKNVWISRASAT